MTILFTGGAGFVGSNFVIGWLAESDVLVINLDKLTYAGNAENLQSLNGDQRYVFVQGDIGDSALLSNLLAKHQLRVIINFAAKSHVDPQHPRPGRLHPDQHRPFHLLEAVRAYWGGLQGHDKQSFRFLHVSTDEVYGSHAKDDPAFTENVPRTSMNPTARTPPPWPLPTIWCAPTTTPMATRGRYALR